MSQFETVLWGIACKKNAGVPLPKAVADLGKVTPWEVGESKSGDKMRIGTLDQLMNLSDDLSKMETLAEATVAKFYKQTDDLIPEKTPSVGGMLPVDFTTQQWEWDESKYALKEPLSELCTTISSKIAQADDDLKNKLSEMNNLKASIAAVERKTTGNLMVKGLASIVNPDEDVVSSDYMMTVFVVVPKANMADFVNGYMDMAKYVVPGTAKQLKEDTEYGLYRVVIFKKSLDEFKSACREKRFTLREYTPDTEGENKENAKVEEDRHALKTVEKDTKKWVSTGYVECYKNLVHLKAVRIFVESVLRFGLKTRTRGGTEPDFDAYFVQPIKGKQETLRKALGAFFADGQVMMEGEEESAVPGATGEFYPYVYTAIETEPSQQQ